MQFQVVIMILLWGACLAYQLDDIIKFGRLSDELNTDGSLSNYTILAIKEDINNPGTLLMISGMSLMSFTLGKDEKPRVIAGDPSEKDNIDGPSLQARFNVPLDFIQYNKTKLAIVDFGNRCIREYDTLTDSVSTLIGKCRGNYTKPDKILDGGKAPINSTLDFPVQVLYLESRGYFMLYGRFDVALYKADIVMGTIEVLNKQLHETSFPNLRYILPNSDESLFYAVHSYGISSFKLDDANATLLVGSVVHDDDKYDAPIKPGPFTNDRLPGLWPLIWLVQDSIILGVTSRDNEALAVIDLEKKAVTYLCVGTKWREKTVLGTLNECQLNSPQSVVRVNNTLYISSLTSGNWRRASFDAPHSLYTFPITVGSCHTTPSNPTTELYEPEQTSYEVYAKVNTGCIDGFGLNSTYNTVVCSSPKDMSAVVEWGMPLPSCVPEIIHTVSPLSGQLAGGTSVTARGVISRHSAVISVVKKFTTQLVEYDYKLNTLTFTMPPQQDTGGASIVFRLKNTSHVVEYNYTENPSIQSSAVVYINGSGIFGRFGGKYLKSAHEYYLQISDEPSQENRVIQGLSEENKVNGELAIYTPFSDYSEDQNVTLYGDGVLIKHSLLVDILPTPVIYRDAILKTKVLSDIKGRLLLLGENLDVKFANVFYNVVLKGDHSRLKCTVIVDEITDAKLPCEVKGNQDIIPNKEYMAQVRLGELEIDADFFLFLPEKFRHDGNPDTAAILTPILATLSVSVIVVIVIVACRRRAVRRADLLEGHINSAVFREENGEIIVAINLDLTLKLKSLTIDPANLSMDKSEPIGEGNFGVIYKGVLTDSDKHHLVAIKTLKEMTATDKILEKFLEEAAIVHDFCHPNVLPTIGVCWPPGSTPQVVLPFMANGDLRSLIRKDSLKLTFGDLLHLAKQVAAGMDYLSSNKFVHRDLAARNCLVSDKYLVKIADFGLSRDIYNADYYRPSEGDGTPLPIKWLALESLDTGRFDSNSDIWSFGVLMWELCTRGSEPYPDVDPWDMRRYLLAGYRLPKPVFVPDIVYNKMKTCWEADPLDRPTFAELYDFLTTLLTKVPSQPNGGYSYVRDFTRQVPDEYVQGVCETGDLFQTRYQNHYFG